MEEVKIMLREVFLPITFLVLATLMVAGFNVSHAFGDEKRLDCGLIYPKITNASESGFINLEVLNSCSLRNGVIEGYAFTFSANEEGIVGVREIDSDEYYDSLPSNGDLEKEGDFGLRPGYEVIYQVLVSKGFTYFTYSDADHIYISSYDRELEKRSLVLELDSIVGTNGANIKLFMMEDKLYALIPSQVDKNGFCEAVIRPLFSGLSGDGSYEVKGLPDCGRKFDATWSGSQLVLIGDTAHSERGENSKIWYKIISYSRGCFQQTSRGQIALGDML